MIEANESTIEIIERIVPCWRVLVLGTSLRQAIKGKAGTYLYGVELAKHTTQGEKTSRAPGLATHQPCHMGLAACVIFGGCTSGM